MMSVYFYKDVLYEGHLLFLSEMWRVLCALRKPEKSPFIFCV